MSSTVPLVVYPFVCYFVDVGNKNPLYKRGRSDAEKVMAYSEPEPNTGCWLWVGGHSADGYARVWSGDRREQLGHRVSYIAFVGPIPDGHEIDHACRQRSCVNPKHLRAVTRSENVRLASLARTKCKNGHPRIPLSGKCPLCFHDRYLAANPNRRRYFGGRYRPIKAHTAAGYGYRTRTQDQSSRPEPPG